MSGSGAEVSCPGKGAPTTPQGESETEQSEFDENRRVENLTLSLEDFELPGLGEPGESCGKNRLPETNTVCPNGDAVRYEPNLCRRVECPDCHAREDRDRVFELSVQLEGMARLRGERPHALVMSPEPEEAPNYSIKNINEQLNRRGRRRAKRKMGALGGVSMVHPARILEAVQDRLRVEGYASGGAKGSLWDGVGEDALSLGDWRNYCYYYPHVHSLGFPTYLDEHTGEFVINKYDTLEDTESVVNHLEYLMSHRGVWNGPDQFTAVRRWGMFHHASKNYVDVEAELGESRYQQVCEDVAGELGGEWSEDDGFHYHEESEQCPECGTPKREFVDLWDLSRLASESWQGGGEWKEQLSDGQWAFFEEIIEILHNTREPKIFLGDLQHPDDVEAWVDGDIPPPESEDSGTVAG